MSGKTLCLVFLSACLVSGSVNAAVFIDDEFEDGAVATNSSGTGDGFEAAVRNQGSIVEEDGLVKIFGGNTGASRSQIGSINSFSANGSPVFGVFTVTDMYRSASLDNGTARFYAGFSDTLPNFAGPLQTSAVNGLWIVIHGRYTFTGVDTWSTGDGGLVFVDSGVRTPLAQWTWDSSVFTFDTASGLRSDRVALDMIAPDLTFVLSSDAAGYSLSFSSSDGGVVLPEPVIGTWAETGLSNGLSEVYASVWTQGVDTSSEQGLVLDRIVVNDTGWSLHPGAHSPEPEADAVDVPRDVILNWAPLEHAQTHNVYLSTSFDDVNDAVLADAASQGQDTNSYDAGRLAFGQTYYWRVDEVNGAPDHTVFRGDVWSFEVEPFGYPIENLQVTASSAHDEGMVPEKTIDGSGLDELDQHSTEPKDMWLSGMGDPAPTIQYEFDQAYKLHEMWVWNSNQLIEGFVGLGAKDVTVEISENGTDWTVLEDVAPFAQAPGKEGYAHNTTVNFGGAVAQYVKLSIHAGYGMLPQYGLSEVRFLYIPTFAREPQPAHGGITNGVDVALNWRPGREAASHEVYLGTDPDDLSLTATTAENSFEAVNLDYATTYYWQIVEVNDAEDPSSHASDIWSFNTPPFAVVDSFDQYDDNCNRIFFAWLDGLGHNGGEEVEDCDVAPYNGNGSGSIVGHGNSPFAEQATVYAGRQSMPLAYDSGTSETTIALAPQDWTASGIQSLSLQVHGAPGNTGQLYLEINNTKIMYDGLADALQREQWVPWNIDLATTGAGLSNVTSLSLGIEGASAPGMIYVDEIRLYPLAPETIDPVVPDPGDPNLVAHYAFEGDTNDSVGNYHGTAEGDPTYTTGKIGQAINLDEVDDNVVHALAQEEVWPAYTVSLWVKTDLMGQDTNSSLFNNNSSSSDFQIEVDGNDDYLYRGTTTGIFGTVSSNWVHIGASCDGIQTSLYYNGLLTAILDVADTNFGQLAVGINRGMANRFGGVIDEVKIYDRALSPGEIAGLAGVTSPVDKPFAAE